MINEKQIITTIVNNILVTKYNWSLILIAALIWYLFLSPFYNSNFDLPSSIFNYLIFFSGATFLTCFIKAENNKSKHNATRDYSILVFLGSIIVLMMQKNFYLSQNVSITLLPLDILGFLMLIKNIYIETTKN